MPVFLWKSGAFPPHVRSISWVSIPLVHSNLQYLLRANSHVDYVCESAKRGIVSWLDVATLLRSYHLPCIICTVVNVWHQRDGECISAQYIMILECATVYCYSYGYPRGCVLYLGFHLDVLLLLNVHQTQDFCYYRTRVDIIELIFVDSCWPSRMGTNVHAFYEGLSIISWSS